MHAHVHAHARMRAYKCNPQTTPPQPPEQVPNQHSTQLTQSPAITMKARPVKAIETKPGLQAAIWVGRWGAARVPHTGATCPLQTGRQAGSGPSNTGAQPQPVPPLYRRVDRLRRGRPWSWRWRDRLDGGGRGGHPGQAEPRACCCWRWGCCCSVGGSLRGGWLLGNRSRRSVGCTAHGTRLGGLCAQLATYKHASLHTALRCRAVHDSPGQAHNRRSPPGHNRMGASPVHYLPKLDKCGGAC